MFFHVGKCHWKLNATVANKLHWLCETRERTIAVCCTWMLIPVLSLGQINFSDNRCHCICINNLRSDEIRKLIPNGRKLIKRNLASKNRKWIGCGLSVTEQWAPCSWMNQALQNNSMENRWHQPAETVLRPLSWSKMQQNEMPIE